MRQQQKQKVHGRRLNYALRKCVREWISAVANTFLTTGVSCKPHHDPFGRDGVLIDRVNIQFNTALQSTVFSAGSSLVLDFHP